MNYTAIIVLFVLIGVAIGALEYLYNQGYFQSLANQLGQPQTASTGPQGETTATTTTVSQVPIFPNAPSVNENPPSPPT